MNSHRKGTPSARFTTYIDFEEINDGLTTVGETVPLRPIDVPEETNVDEEKIEPHLLPGEIMIARANNVLKFAPLKANRTGISGTLFVTNFKVSFVTSLPVETKERDMHSRSLQNRFLGVHDVCLSEVDMVNQFSEDSAKKKRLLYNTQMPPRLSGLQLVLKSLRVINFSFKFTPTGEDIRVAQALLHHAFPTSIDHLFLSCGYAPSSPGIPDFCRPADWEHELQRTRCPNWRVSKHNEFFNLCASLPTVLVVPRDLLDAQLEQAAQHFQGTRPPVWCWGTPAGAALVRMAQISPSITDKQQENRMMGLVHRCHPMRLQPKIFDLDQILPSLKEIQISYIKLRELHTPDDPTQFWEQDRHYFSRLESSRWLSHVSKCLEVAQNAATAILHQNSSVILQDASGCDLSAVISSLVQLLLDPHVRTIRGFHCLIQKEWVALGHPFTKRLGHTRNQVEEQSPVWLLFLDCVYQVSLQHHTALEFTSEYLVALWHAAHCSLHSSFMFNSVSAKYSASDVLQRENPQQPIYLRPVWSWWAENKSIIENEQNGSDEEPLDCKTSAREAFLNVHYIQKLFKSLAISGAVRRISDPLSSAYHTWQHIDCLMGETRQLPYDPATPIVPLQLDGSLRLDTSLSNLRPWLNCFCAWLSEPAMLTLNDSESLLKDSSPASHHWSHIHEMYNTMKDLLSQNLTNGAAQ
ncbi:myotubularin-related protein 10-B-like isoform X6 [Portunus trituberculatus]|uniref:myotubularin-related protein 10-B-like isoform X6 n=1 Tax=Portunus trituberculatus TaxID=210409 RepID=UPI001E1CB665|nr:myotubularin-related protein 10-B-like isoform X6 [Portunus trituberculatus]